MTAHHCLKPHFPCATKRAIAAAATLLAVAQVPALGGGPQCTARVPILFASQGRTGMIYADGSKPRYLDFKVPGQATWQPGPIFPWGRRATLVSMEPRRDGPGRPFDKYYSKTPTHIWAYDVESGRLEELCTKERKAPFETPAMPLGDGRILIQVVRDMVGQIYSVRLDGSDAREFTRKDEGMPYGFSLSPDGRRVAFHLATPAGYQVFTADTDGSHRARLAAQPGHLYFGTNWSPDGQWVVYVDCPYQQDPAHDWADVCIGRADGNAHYVVTRGGAMWFGATYGDPATRGGGSNVPVWTRDCSILFPRRTAGAKVAWEFQPKRPDVDHFNRDYKPALARGGTHICRLNPWTGCATTLTPVTAGVWDFRCSESPDGDSIVFCRAETGGPPALWVMDADGANARQLTRGLDNRGADHPHWVP